MFARKKFGRWVLGRVGEVGKTTLGQGDVNGTRRGFHQHLKAPLMERRGDPKGLIASLTKLFPNNPEQVVTNSEILRAHAKDESFHDPLGAEPDVVFCPRSVDEVCEAMKLAAKFDVNVIPFGAGTSLEGHVAALGGGLTIDMGMFMTKVLEINEMDMDCRVQAGVRRVALNDQLRHTGLFFPVDPGADATVGGMVSTSASGTNCVRYGTIKENVTTLQVVLANGEIMNVGSRARKSSSGYDMKSLFIGSEGTLGCVTEIGLRLYGQPEAIASAVCSFDSTEGAINTVVTAMQYGVPLARAEFLDAASMGAVFKRFEKDMTQLLGSESAFKPCLFLEFHGTQKAVNEQIETMESLAKENGASGEFLFATAEEDRNHLWKARHQAYYAVLQLRHGGMGAPTDVCVPISKLAECIEATKEDIKAGGFVAPIFGHIGDGNFHVILLATPEDSPEYMDSLFAFNDRLVERALSMGGTCTGEHGIGYGKRKWIVKEHGETGKRAMEMIKRSFDPDNRLNPGKAI